MQETSFPYEIIIHDDASTDGTPVIINNYAEKNINIIPVLQKENQYSRNVKIFPNFVFPIARGKYIAICEGDDYWTDRRKLQKQIDYMEEHPECTLCVHASSDVTVTGEFIKKRQRYKTDRVVPMEDLILGGGGFVVLSSTVFPSSLRCRFPEYYFNSPVGDVPMHLFLASCGNIYYFHDNMSSYRTDVAGSWTSRVGDGIGEKQQMQQYLMSAMYLKFAKSINERYRIYAEFMSLKCQIHGARIRKKLNRSEVDLWGYLLKELKYIKAKAIVHLNRYFTN
jgi:glycosyltransferase involved in cell wall biosynthesis